MNLGLREMNVIRRENVTVWNFYKQKREKATKVVYKCPNGHTMSWTY